MAMDANSQSSPDERRPARRFGSLQGIGLAALVMVGIGALWCLRPVRPAPEISLNILGYTNRVGPYAFIAITNRCDRVITLEPRCMVEYAAKRSVLIPNSVGPPHVTWIEGNVFRVTELRPHEGVVQEFFVFPSGDKAQWKFVYLASYKSSW